jgi:hypothetical protein
MHKWNKNLWLFTPEEFKQLPDGTVLTAITEEKAIKGVDEIDQDVRFGHIAWGVSDPWDHPLAELFTVFKLTQ